MADPARAVSELLNWAERLHLDTTDPNDRAKANAVLGCILDNFDALLVLDNLEDPALLDRDLPGLVNASARSATRPKTIAHTGYRNYRLSADINWVAIDVSHARADLEVIA
jgi:hypothetical protein